MTVLLAASLAQVTVFAFVCLYLRSLYTLVACFAGALNRLRLLLLCYSLYTPAACVRGALVAAAAVS